MKDLHSAGSVLSSMKSQLLYNVLKCRCLRLVVNTIGTVWHKTFLFGLVSLEVQFFIFLLSSTYRFFINCKYFFNPLPTNDGYRRHKLISVNAR